MAVSVIIPTWNMAGFLPEAICSVLASDFKGLELVVVDDGSTDNTRKIFKKIIQEVGRGENCRTIYCFQANKGRPGAINLGLKKASGDYIAVVDADDMIPHCSLRERYEIARRTGADLVVGGFQIIDKQGCVTGHRAVDEGATNKQLIRKILYYPLSPMHLNATLMARELIEKTGLMDEKLLRSEDRDYCIRLLNKAEKVVTVNKPFYQYRKYRTSWHGRLRFRIRAARDRARMLAKHTSGVRKPATLLLNLGYDMAKMFYELFGNYRR